MSIRSVWTQRKANPKSENGPPIVYCRFLFSYLFTLVDCLCLSVCLFGQVLVKSGMCTVYHEIFLDKKRYARRAFNYTAPTIWNSLPADILTCDSESGFKRLLKTLLFNNCFNVAWLTHSQRLCSSAYGAVQICLWYDMMIWLIGFNIIVEYREAWL